MKRKLLTSKSNTRKFMNLLILGATMLLITVLFSSAGFAWPHKINPLVHTQYGLIRGFKDLNNTLAWKSIPYAEPPVGDLRWRAPVDPDPWSGVLNANSSCAPCAQMGVDPVTYAATNPIGSEDCLYLNIWRPNNDKLNLPVYVWIHGGSNIYGSISQFDGATLASKSNVVVVFIQYRLGPFGWLYDPSLKTGDPSEDGGNFGTLDHIKALTWIKENISAFGGNPDNVLITGESAGAHNVMNLVLSPLAKGLFHRAMSESGGMHPVTLDDPLDQYNGVPNNAYMRNTLPLLSKLGLSPSDPNLASQLRSKGTEELINAYWAAGAPDARAHIDGYVLPGDYVSTIRTGNYNKVPIILGANHDEMKYFQPLSGLAYIAKLYGAPTGDYTWEDLYSVIGIKPNPLHLMLDDVFPTQHDKDVYQAIANFGSLNWRYNFVDSVARAFADQPDQKVYAYHFNWDGTDPYRFALGAAHATEIPFFFGLPIDIYGGAAFNPSNDTRGRRALSNAMMDYLANFAYTGNPNHRGLPIWWPWSNKANRFKAIVFDANKFWPDIHMTLEEITSADVDTAFQNSFIAGPILPYIFNWYPWVY